MTPELREFRKWGIVADLVQRFSCLEPVVLNTDGIAMLVVYGDKAFFFFSDAEDRIVVNTCAADSGDMISSSMLFPAGMPDCITFREIAHLVIAKTLNQ